MKIQLKCEETCIGTLKEDVKIDNKNLYLLHWLAMQAKTTRSKALTRMDKIRKLTMQSAAEGAGACVLSSSIASTQCDPMGCGLPGAFVPGNLQGRILEWVAVSSSRDLLTQGSNPRSCTAGGFFTTGSWREALDSLRKPAEDTERQ